MGEMTVAAAAIQLVLPPVGTGLKEVGIYLGKKIESSKQLDERYTRLNDALTLLLAQKEDIVGKVERQKQKVTTNFFNLWTNRISKIDTEVASLSNKYEEVRKRKWRIWKRSSLGEKMAAKLKEVLDLSNQLPNDILADKPPEPVLKELGVPRIMGYPTLQGALEEILALLKNDRVKRIGVCGTKGVGKTTIMRNLNNNEEAAKLFDIVIFIRMPANETDLKIQQRIADRLMVDREGNDSDEVARRIKNELENRKYLLILDGVEHEINFNVLGIPEDNNDGKVVIATQYPHVCKSNSVKRKVNVKQLSPDEAWKMFRDIVGDVIDFPDIEPIARLVCTRCSCHPLLIHKIASTFKLKDSASSWQAGLEDLKPWPQLGIEGLEELYSCLKFCYDQLKDEKKQSCFLYTSLYPADSNIYADYLVECWIAQRFLGDVNATTEYQSVRNQGIATLGELINVSLLEKGEQMAYVSMNDCIRQLAFQILCKPPQYTYVESEESEQPLILESWQHARWVSMISSKRDSLPTNQDCSKLQTLLLKNNSKLAEIPQATFDNMCKLLVLDLSGTEIRELPSLSKLTSLKAFYLNNCSLLKMLPSEVELLQQLEVLDIRGTQINFIPCLISLRCLRIPYITGSDQSGDQGNHDVISKLCKLEELIIEVKSLEQWCNDAKYVIQQVASLENLTTFRCSFPSSENLKNFLETSKSWRGQKQFTSFQFFVGCANSERPKILESFEYKISNYVKYCNGEKKDDLAISKILPRTYEFELICHKDIRNLSEFVEASSLNCIRGFLIQRCNRISTIVEDDQVGVTPLLPNLEQLYLDNLLHLKYVSKGPLHPGSFSKLCTLTLKSCPILRSIFLKVTIQDFPELQKLVVQNCSEIEKLITSKEVTEREQRVLPKLETLILDDLSNLRSICLNENLAWPSLRLLSIHNCLELKSLPFSTTNAAKLRTIKGEQEWWRNLKWTDNKVQERFESTFSAST